MSIAIFARGSDIYVEIGKINRVTLTLRSFLSFAVNFGFTFFTAPDCAAFRIPPPALVPPAPVDIVAVLFAFTYEASVVASASV